jgi:hypothetical protein
VSTSPPPLPLDCSCPRCGGGFACGAATGACDCFGLRLSDALRTELAARWPGRCLCLGCLRELSAPPPGAPQA